MTKATNFFSTPTPLAQQPFDERAACTYTWDMLEANQRAFMFMHDSMHQLQLQVKEPQIDHTLPSLEAFRQHANGMRACHFIWRGKSMKKVMKVEMRRT